MSCGRKPKVSLGDDVACGVEINVKKYLKILKQTKSTSGDMLRGDLVYDIFLLF